MRAIALAILLAGLGLEGTILKANGKTWVHESAQAMFVLAVFVAFVVCLLMGV